MLDVWRKGGEYTHLDFEKVFRRAIDLLKALLAGIWHGLHLDNVRWDRNVGVMSSWVVP